MCTTAISKGRRTLTVGTHLEKTCSTSLKKQFPENYNNVCLAFQFLEIHETPANMGEQFNCLRHLQYGWWSNLSWEKQFRMKNFCNHWEHTTLQTLSCEPHVSLALRATFWRETITWQSMTFVYKGPGASWDKFFLLLSELVRLRVGSTSCTLKRSETILTQNSLVDQEVSLCINYSLPL